MMNERIKLLAEQARKHFPKTEMSGEFWVFDEEKFAELIIQECVSVINTEAGEREDDDEYERAWKMGTEFAVYQIKQHFGVSTHP